MIKANAEACVEYDDLQKSIRKYMKVYLQTASLFACYDRLDLILDKKCRCIYCLSDRSLKSDLCFCSLRTCLHVASRLVFSFRLHNTVIRLLNHVTTSYIFKNLNLRKKADHNFRCVFLKNRFRRLKLYSNLPSWLAGSRYHMRIFWKTKDWSSHFWESQPFKFWYVEVHCQRRLKWTKQILLLNFRPWPA